ncbi:hypothetical protein K504DRAFT_462881 [Pleomassaria siparia CBS 279.74]|uniref:Uncharacterized protein n=1 Tax=Pleomassaria siparia CBS 279.74 TaxID=1314801 RepID=A0A6G1JVL2_9PLEO|nr:hypothetical protein K504DRAFT_462881 [Pleomassaria siparia CBS 279.74]
MLIGVGVIGYAGLGMFLTDKAEEKFGLVPTDKDREELKKAMPKITTIEKPTK